MDNKSIIIQYPPSKTLDQLTKFLHETKHVQYNIISEKQAQIILWKFGYVNVITPFVHHFSYLKYSHKANLNKNIEFSDFYDLYKKERSKYPVIANNILIYETQFKSILSYEVVTNHNLSDSNQLHLFFEEISLQISNNTCYKENRIQHMVQQIADLESNIEKYHDVYSLFDHISLGTALTIYIGLPNNFQEQIFSAFKQLDMTLGVEKINDFITKVFMLVSIRNCVMHCNSLEMLIQFYNPKTQTLRKQRSKKNYVKMINFLSKEKQYTY